MSFRLVSKSVTLNDLERRNRRYFALFQRNQQFKKSTHKKYSSTNEQVSPAKRGDNFHYKNSSGDEIANVNFYACTPGKYLISLK